MPQATDNTINGAGYMVEPGTYKRAQDGMAEGRAERIALTDFFGGQARALQLERDKFATSLNVGPALDGQGVRPWVTTQFEWPLSLGPTIDKPVPHAIVRDTLYFALAEHLYRIDNISTASTYAVQWSRTYPNPITDICIYASNGLLVAFGSAADLIFRRTDTGQETAMLAGERAQFVEAYAEYGVWTDARVGSRPTILRLATGSSLNQRFFEHDPIGLTTVGGELVIVTKQALYTFTGRVKDVMVTNPAYTQGGSAPPTIPGQEWSGELTPYFQQGVYTDRDDYKLLVSYGGRVVAWIAGGVHEQVPSGDRAGWRSTGLSGKRCFGGCVAAGYVVVSIESHSGQNEVWAYDGNGWWRIFTQAMDANPLCWPVPIGTAAGFNVMFFAGSGGAVRYFNLSGYANTATFITPMIDGGQRDKPKAWRKLGAVFASPEKYGNQASADTVGVALTYSIDGGITWSPGAWGQTIATYNGNTLAHMNFELKEPLSGAISPFIMLKVTWWDVSDWAPILVGVWAEYEVLHSPARRRKWAFKVHAQDQTIDRDGKTLTRTGRQLIAELWSAWQSDTVLPFRDIDYDADPTQRQVRIVGISELVEQPADSAEWGDSVITLSLVEV